MSLQCAISVLKFNCIFHLWNSFLNSTFFLQFHFNFTGIYSNHVSNRYFIVSVQHSKGFQSKLDFVIVQSQFQILFPGYIYIYTYLLLSVPASFGFIVINQTEVELDLEYLVCQFRMAKANEIAL